MKKKQKQGFASIIQLTEYFSSEKVCRKYLERMRWADGVKVCPHCGSTEKIYVMKHNYKCSACRKQFSLTKGTIFEKTKVSLQKWFVAIYLLSAHKKGISSCQLAEDLGVTQKTAWFMTQRIREMFKTGEVKKFETAVEIDETYVGGKSEHQGRSTKTKTVVFGILERESKTVMAQTVENAKAVTLVPIIEDHVEKDTEVFTDEWKAYSRLYKLYNHSKVNHSKGEYVQKTFLNEKKLILKLSNI
ncbi:MAG: IS1595 family transposase [Bacteroidetes bacterium]|nr:IS1595 family transposase [Bacteroidota bacterium]